MSPSSQARNKNISNVALKKKKTQNNKWTNQNQINQHNMLQNK